MKVTVNENKRTLSRDGQPFFYLADTCWSAFTSIQEDEWISYLTKRKQQGFNTLQINVLPQWDRSKNNFECVPFEINDGTYDFSKVNEDYFKRAQKLCQIAEEYDFTLALVVLWSNYVSGTWASELDGNKNIISEKNRQRYYQKIIETFDSFKPIYFIGGDTDFPTDETVSTYLDAFDFFEKNSPDTLKTVHIRGRLEEIPEEIVERLDIFLYQSGHNSSFLNMPYYLADVFYNNDRKLPIINSEPCYEQMGFSRRVYGRFSQFDVRKAAWQSILSGACAGITYGAHGVWSWHTESAKFAENIGEAFDSPMVWREAVQFPGANDYGFIAQLLDLIKVRELIPCQNKLLNANEQIRIAMTENQSHYLIYMPSATRIILEQDVSEYKVLVVDLKNNVFLTGDYKVVDGHTIIDAQNILEDSLLVIYK